MLIDMFYSPQVITHTFSFQLDCFESIKVEFNIPYYGQFYFEKVKSVISYLNIEFSDLLQELANKPISEMERVTSGNHILWKVQTILENHQDAKGFRLDVRNITMNMYGGTSVTIRCDQTRKE